MTHPKKAVSINPKTFVRDDPEEKISQMSFVSFLAGEGVKLAENTPPESWTETSFRFRIPGMQERYASFADSSGTTLFNVLRVQEYHWLCSCVCTPELVAVRKSHVLVMRRLATSKYADIMSYIGDLRPVHLGVPSSVPTNVKHPSDIASRLSAFARALRVDYADLAEIGRAWSLSTNPEYKDWSDEFALPAIADLLDRATKIVVALNEAEYLLDYRLRRDKPESVIAAPVVGSPGGVARAAKLTPERRAEIARKAAQNRWKKDDF